MEKNADRVVSLDFTLTACMALQCAMNHFKHFVGDAETAARWEKLWSEAYALHNEVGNRIFKATDLSLFPKAEWVGKNLNLPAIATPKVEDEDNGT